VKVKRHGKDRNGNKLIWTDEHKHPWVVRDSQKSAWLTLKNENLYVIVEAIVKWKGRLEYLEFELPVRIEGCELKYKIPWQNGERGMSPQMGMLADNEHIEALEKFLVALARNTKDYEPKESLSYRLEDDKVVEKSRKMEVGVDIFDRGAGLSRIFKKWKTVEEGERVLGEDEYELLGWEPYYFEVCMPGYHSSTHASSSGEQLKALVNGKEVILASRKQKQTEYEEKE